MSGCAKTTQGTSAGVLDVDCGLVGWSTSDGVFLASEWKYCSIEFVVLVKKRNIYINKL